MQRVALADPFYTHPYPFDRPIFLHRFQRILRAGRQEPAGRWEKRRYEPLVATDQEGDEVLHGVASVVGVGILSSEF